MQQDKIERERSVGKDKENTSNPGRAKSTQQKSKKQAQKRKKYADHCLGNLGRSEFGVDLVSPQIHTVVNTTEKRTNFALLEVDGSPVVFGHGPADIHKRDNLRAGSRTALSGAVRGRDDEPTENDFGGARLQTEKKTAIDRWKKGYHT